MDHLDNETILKKLERIIDTQELLREYISNLKERMSSLEMMLGKQMVQHGQMQLRINRIEDMARRRPGREPDTLPEIH